jgi:hypothetical protein
MPGCTIALMTNTFCVVKKKSSDMGLDFSDGDVYLLYCQKKRFQGPPKFSNGCSEWAPELRLRTGYFCIGSMGSLSPVTTDH